MLRDILYYGQLVLEAATGIFGVRLYEEPRYRVAAELPNGVEIRYYAPRLAAQVELPGQGAEARDEAFRALFRYIAGANTAAEKISMTTPVATGARAETIAMTVPVATAQRGGGLRMQFYLPAKYTMQSAPVPADSLVQLVPVPEETVAVLRFTGRGLDDDLASRKAELLGALAPTEWRAAAEPTVLFYDAPFTIPFLRRNEASVRIEPR
jgi:hypothetical protein